MPFTYNHSDQRLVPCFTLLTISLVFVKQRWIPTVVQICLRVTKTVLPMSVPKHTHARMLRSLSTGCKVSTYNSLSAPKAIVSKHYIHEDKIISIAIFTFSRANVLIMRVSSNSQIVQNCTIDWFIQLSIASSDLEIHIANLLLTLLDLACVHSHNWDFLLHEVKYRKGITIR
jgi:hypothetical protein